MKIHTGANYQQNNEISTLVLKSPMVTGKTEAITDYIKKYEPKRILCISTRQSYSNNVFQRLKTFNFINYF